MSRAAHLDYAQAVQLLVLGKKKHQAIFVADMYCRRRNFPSGCQIKLLVFWANHRGRSDRQGLTAEAIFYISVNTSQILP